MSLTSSSAAHATTTNTVPNLKGGANPATPMLAGIVCGACVGVAWIVAFFYWWWNRKNENVNKRLALYKLGDEDGISPKQKIQSTGTVPGRNRASSQVRSMRQSSVPPIRQPSVATREKPNGAATANGTTH
ncbi:hypothetical protein FRC02_007712 [Tulasnella sp. 418]|nr:hypothetical protein FRC02_007712 [Tulasnella sp. 418]